MGGRLAFNLVFVYVRVPPGLGRLVPNQKALEERMGLGMTRRERNSGLVLSLGSINADFQVRVERRPEVSETLLGKDFKRLGGGKAANVAFFARRLGVDARLFGHVGDDDLAEQALAPLRKIGVDLSAVKTMPGESTGVAMVTVPPDGQKGITMAPNANAVWSPEDAEQVTKYICEVPAESVLVINAEVPATVLEQAISAARHQSMTIILDPSPADRVTDSLIAAAAYVTPNASEAEQLTGVDCQDADSAVRAGACLRERGAAAVCVKLPRGGCVLVEEDRVTQVGAVPVDVVDSTGAGDAFAGALAVALLEGFTQTEAVRWAVAASHLTVTGYGAQAAYPAREQLEQMARQLRD